MCRLNNMLAQVSLVVYQRATLGVVSLVLDHILRIFSFLTRAKRAVRPDSQPPPLEGRGSAAKIVTGIVADFVARDVAGVVADLLAVFAAILVLRGRVLGGGGLVGA